jgi:hypothetical protein
MAGKKNAIHVAKLDALLLEVRLRLIHIIEDTDLDLEDNAVFKAMVRAAIHPGGLKLSDISTMSFVSPSMMHQWVMGTSAPRLFPIRKRVHKQILIMLRNKVK